MKEQSDTLVSLIQDAAGQVGPLDGIDGEAMAVRAIRRERVRRGALGGAVVVLLVVLGAAGTAWFTGRPILPALPWVQNLSAPSEVHSDGLAFEVPAGYEEFDPAGDSMWGLDPEVPNELEAMDGRSAYADSWVAVAPAEDVPLAGELAGNPVVDVDVPGAVSARWSWQTAQEFSNFWQRGPGDGDFVGELDVELGSGTVVRLTMSLADDDTPRGTFEQLVRTVRVDEEVAVPEPPSTDALDDLPLQETTEPPASWERAELDGLKYAVPRGWEPVTAAGTDHPADTVLLRRPDGRAELELAVTEQLDNSEFHDEVEPLPDFYRFELAGADVSNVLIERFDGEYRAYVEVRRAGGASYRASLSGYEGTPDLDDELAAVLGGLGFTGASKDETTGYDALEPADPFLQDPPSGWETVTFEGVRLSLPPELRSDEGTWGIWSSQAEAWEELSIAPWDMEPYDKPLDLHEDGYRYEPPGTTRGTVTVGTDTETGEPLFAGRATFYLTADGRKAFEVRYDGVGATEERWWQILASLDASGVTSP